MACTGYRDDFAFVGWRIGERRDKEVGEKEVAEVVGCELDFVAGWGGLEGWCCHYTG